MKTCPVSRYSYSVKTKKKTKNNIKFGMNYNNPANLISLKGDIASIKTFMPATKNFKEFLIEYFNNLLSDNFDIEIRN